MLYPAMSELLKNVDSRYLLVNVVAHRARQLSIESELTHEPLEEKPVTLAIREVAAGSLKATLDDKYRQRLPFQGPIPPIRGKCPEGTKGVGMLSAAG